MRDAFGRCLVSPATLPRLERIAELRRLAARLQADRDPPTRWLGACLARWMAAGADFADVLKINPDRGSRATVQALLRQERTDAALLAVATAARCDRLALRWLRGEAVPPAEHAGAVEEAREVGAPTGPHAISRARRRVIARQPMTRSFGQWPPRSTERTDDHVPR